MAPGRGPARLLAALAAGALIASTAGCAGVQSATCVDWVDYASPADATADAGLVVLTTGPAARAGTAELFGVTVAVHAVEVQAVLSGAGAAPGQTVAVISTPETCSGRGVYPEGDPLDASGSLVVFLYQDPDTKAWRTITPYQGVVPATRAGQVPEAWPSAP